MWRAVYRKNIRQWEQWSRVVAGLAMIVAAVAVSAWVGRAVLVGGGVAMIVTGFLGWCPACAMFGRTLERERGRAAA